MKRPDKCFQVAKKYNVNGRLVAEYLYICERK